MTVPATARRAGPFSGNGVATSFPFTFKVFATSDIEVVLADEDGLETVLVLGSRYSVTLNSDQDASPGGSVTYPLTGAPLPAGSTLTIRGAVPYDQALDLPSGGAFSPRAIENALDRTTQQIQQLVEELDRSLTLPLSAAGADTQLPVPAAGKFLGWNDTATGLANRDATDLASVIAYGTNTTQFLSGDGTQTEFTLDEDPGSVHNLDVSISGVVQSAGVDFTLAGVTLTFAEAPPEGVNNIAVRSGQALPVGVVDWADVRNDPVLHVARFVVGDGAADDTEALRAVHVAANAAGAKVSYAGVPVIAVQANAMIVVNTDVDFANCRFILLGGVDPTPDYDDINTVFHVYDATRPVVTATTPITASSSLVAGSRTPTLGAFNGPGYAELTCSGVTVPDRATTGTMSYKQSFKVLRNGRVQLPLSVDLSAHRLACAVVYRQDSLKGIKLENAVFPATGWNNQYIFRIERNDVWFDNMRFPADAGTPQYDSIDALFYGFRVSDIRFTNMMGPARSPTFGFSSYFVNVTSGANIVLKDCHFWDGWGTVANNDLNGLFVSDSTLNRVDCHSGGFNIFVSNSVLQGWSNNHEYGAVSFGWGGGVISVTDTRVDYSHAVQGRDDYGGTFFGSIVVKNVQLNHPANAKVPVVMLDKLGASTPVYAPETIIIDGVTRIEGRPAGNFGIDAFRIRVLNPATQQVFAPARIEVRNVSSSPNWAFSARLDLYNMEPAPNANNRLRVLLENISADKVASVAAIEGLSAYSAVRTPTNRIRPRFEVNNCWNFYLDMRYDVPEFEVFMTGGSLNGIIRDTGHTNQPRIHLRGVDLADNVVGSSPAPVGGTTSATSGHTTLSDCYISSSAFDLSLVAAFQGCIVRSGVSPTLPAGVTTADIFTGWRKSATFA